MAKIPLPFLSLAAAFCFSPGAAQAATISLSNFVTSGDASGIGSSSGGNVVYRGGTSAGSSLGGTWGGTSAGPGFVTFGIFTSTDFNGVPGIEGVLDQRFVAFGTGGTFSVAGANGSRGIFSLSQSGTVTGSNFEGKTLYVVVAGSDFSGTSNAGQALILKTSFQFDASLDSAGTTNFAIDPTNSSIAFGVGSTISDIRTTNSDSTTNPGWWTVTTIPEPSTILMTAGLGVFGLLRRRR